jgi:hypothetical protein
MAAELKTKKNNDDVGTFLARVPNDKRRAAAQTVCRLMEEVTGEEPVMWGDSIVGFGAYHYKYASGREGDWPRIGLSPRKANLTLYFMDGFGDHSNLLDKLGKYKTAKSCLYIKSLEDIDVSVLKEMISKSYKNKAMGEA